MKKKTSCRINGFKYPSSDKISGRISTICRSMACTLLKRDSCTPEQEEMWMKFFPQKECAYCGKEATHLDHLYALIDDKKPTGYGTEPANLVPCCRKCNQSKGNMIWDNFMRSSKCQHENDDTVELRIENIKRFQETMPAYKVEIDDEILKRWSEILEAFDERLRVTEEELKGLKNEIYRTESN